MKKYRVWMVALLVLTAGCGTYDPSPNEVVSDSAEPLVLTGQAIRFIGSGQCLEAQGNTLVQSSCRFTNNAAQKFTIRSAGGGFTFETGATNCINSPMGATSGTILKVGPGCGGSDNLMQQWQLPEGGSVVGNNFRLRNVWSHLCLHSDYTSPSDTAVHEVRERNCAPGAYDTHEYLFLDNF